MPTSFNLTNPGGGKYENMVYMDDGLMVKEEIGYRSRKWRFILVVVAAIVVAGAIAGIIIGVTRSKDGDKSDDKGDSSSQGGNVQTTHSPSTLPSSPTPSASTSSKTTTTPTSTTPKHDWLSEPCNDEVKLPQCPWSNNPLLLVSLDGFRAEYLTRNLTPAIKKLSQCGVHTPYMRAAYPTLTFPNHYTIVTGLYPESHGIVGNSMYDPHFNESFSMGGDEKFNSHWWGGEPLWATAKKQGKKTASYYWVGSEMNISGYQPDIWFPYGNVPFEERVDTVIEWLEKDEASRPDFITLYMDEPDHTGHGDGPVSEGVDAMLERVDSVIEYMMNGLSSRNLDHCVNIIILADHGMESISNEREVSLKHYLPEVTDMLVYQGTTGYIHRRYHKTGRRAQEIKDPMSTEEIVDALQCKNPHMNVFSKSNIPVRHHYTRNDRIGDVIIDIEASWLFSSGSYHTNLKGNHGYDNIYKSMHALFLAHGPSFKQRFEAAPFENIELYNLMTDLLKIKPAPNNGTEGSLHYLLRTSPVVDTSGTSSVSCSNGQSTRSDGLCNCEDTTTVSTPLYPFGVTLTSNSAGACVKQSTNVATVSSSLTQMPLLASFSLKKSQAEAIPTCSPMCSGNGCHQFTNPQKDLEAACLFNTGIGLSVTDRMSVTVPMLKGFKDGIWSFLEKLAEDYVSRYNHVHITTGPIYDYNHDGLADIDNSTLQYVNDDKTVPLPSHYFAILTKCSTPNVTLEACAFEHIQVISIILPHQNKSANCLEQKAYLLNNVARVRDVELLTGTQFFTHFNTSLGARIRTFLPGTLWESDLVTPWVDLPCPVPDDPKCPSGKKPLLLISLDGFRADYLERGLTPVIQRLSQCGVHTPFMRSVYPTVTFPNHYSIVTGLYPESHGIIGNTMYDAEIGEVFTLSAKTSKDPRWWKGEPLWITAQKQGLKTSTYFWPGTEVNISGIYPDTWKPYDGKAGYTERVYEVLDWLSQPEDTRPEFVTLYFDEPDHAGHSGGPDSEQVNGMLETVDELINILMTNLYDRGLHNCVNLIIVADHGMSPQSCDRTVKVDNYIPEVGQMFTLDHTLGHIFPQFHQIGRGPVSPQNKTYNIEDIVANLTCKEPVMNVFTKETLPRRHHYTNNVRIGDVLMDMKDTWLVLTKDTNFCDGGNHGWDNINKNMHALFLAHGPAFKNNFTAEPFENIELYNMMSDVLGIQPAANNGTSGSLDYILRQPEVPTSAPPVNDDKCSDPHEITYSKSCTVQVNPDFVYQGSGNALFGLPRGVNTSHCIIHQGATTVGYSQEMTSPVWLSLTVGNNSFIKPEDEESACYVNDARGNDDTWTVSVANDTLELMPLVGSGIRINGTVVYTKSTTVPMYPGFKAGVWKFMNDLIEDYTRLYGNISVTSGPIYDYNNDGLWEGIINSTQFADDKQSPPIPTHIYVSLIKCRQPQDSLPCSGPLDILPFIIPHLSKIPNCQVAHEHLSDNVARIRDIELLTGLEFMTSFNVTMAARLRTYLPEKLWTTTLIKDWQELPCPHQDKCSSDYQPLLLISLDGFRADYLLRNATPTISRLSQCGVHAPYMRSVYPTKTFPNHYSIVTGLYPESHGVIDNNMYDLNIKERFRLGKPTTFDPRWWGGDPFWLTAKQQGHKTATYFWPGSDVKINGQYPDIWRKYDGSVSYSSRVREVLTWLQLPKNQRPSFITLYFDQPDLAGHKYGPSNEEKIAESLNTVDRSIHELMTGLYNQNMHNCVNLVIIADHGMADVDCKNVIRLKNLVDYDYLSDNTYVWEGPFGRIANQYTYNYTVKNPTPVAVPASVEGLVNNLTCADPHLNVYRKETIPMRHHYSNNERIDDVILDMESGWLVTRSYINTCHGGNHGYDNMDKSMEALFLAYGPAFKWNKTVDAFENIELYNMFSDLLNVTAAPNNGTTGSLDHILQHPPVRTSAENQSLVAATIKHDTAETYRTFVKSSKCFETCTGISDSMIDTVYQTSSSTMPIENSKHIPFGIPKIQTNRTQSLFVQNSLVMGADEVNGITLWISQTLGPNQLLNSTMDCVIPDPRVATETFHDLDICNQSVGLTTTSLALETKGPSNGDIRTLDHFLSATVFKMHQSFIKEVWQPLQLKVQQFLQKYGDVNVLSGPVYDFNHDSLPDSPQSIKDRTVPSHFYVVLTRCSEIGPSLDDCQRYTTASYILRNSANVTMCKTIEEYLIDNEARVRDVEIATGLKLYSSLPREQSVRIRTFLPEGIWNV